MVAEVLEVLAPKPGETGVDDGMTPTADATVRQSAVDEFTDAYNALRYGGDAAAAERMKRILQELS